MKKKVRPPEDTGTWMNTYSDLVTLLLTFFVLLYSMSSVDAEKWEMIVKAFSNPGDDTQQVVIGNAQDQGDQLLTATGGRLLGEEAVAERTITGVETDSRAVHEGDLFVALRGERTDGHRYIASALETGAAGCLTEEVPQVLLPGKFYFFTH